MADLCLHRSINLIKFLGGQEDEAYWIKKTQNIPNTRVLESPISTEFAQATNRRRSNHTQANRSPDLDREPTPPIQSTTNHPKIRLSNWVLSPSLRMSNPIDYLPGQECVRGKSRNQDATTPLSCLCPWTWRLRYD